MALIEAASLAFSRKKALPGSWIDDYPQVMPLYPGVDFQLPVRCGSRYYYFDERSALYDKLNPHILSWSNTYQEQYCDIAVS